MTMSPIFIWLIFQSTLPRRERLENIMDPNTSHKISIHAPAKGATKSFAGWGLGMGISIHAPAKGATHDLHFHDCCHSISIHAPAKGATYLP